MNQHTLHATAHTTFALAARLVIQAATLLIVARLLGPLAFGEFAGLASLAVTLGALSSFGTNVVLLSEVSKNSKQRDSVLSYALPTTCFLGLLLFGIYVLIAQNFLHISEIDITSLVAIGLSETIVQPLITIIGMEYQGQERTAYSQWLLNLPLFIRLLIALALWLSNSPNPINMYANGYLATAAVVLVGAIFTLRTAWPHINQWRRPTYSEFRHSAGFALLNVTAISPAELDKTLALRVLPFAAAGVYAAGTRVVGALILPVIAMMLSVLPRMFREHSKPQFASNHLLQWIICCAGIYSLVIALALWQMSPLIQTIFGKHYVGLGDAIRWLCAVLPGMALRIVAGSALMSMGKPWFRVGFEVVGLVVLGFAALNLPPRFGLHGMALALCCSEWSMAILGCAIIALYRHRHTVIDDATAA